MKQQKHCRRVGGLTAIMMILLSGDRIAAAADAAPPAGADSNQSISQIVQRLILQNLRGEYENNKDWGRTTAAISGLKVEGHGLKLHVKKRTHQVNDGLWKRYRVSLVDPQKQLHVRIADLHSTGDKYAFQLFLTARLHGEAQVEHWAQGVKLLNFKADGEGTVEARLDCQVALKRVPGKGLGTLTVEPRVTAIDLRLVDFDLERVSKIEGKAAHELGNGLKKTIQKQLHRREEKLLTKINGEIQKHQDRLRFSAEDFLASRWSKLQAALGLGDAKPAETKSEPKTM